MEIRARYILMGLFLLAVIAGVFGFVYWLENEGGFRNREVYRIRFDSSVSGLYTGSAVLFNGIRIGEVTALRISPERPSEVSVDIAVEAGTPIRADTTVDLEYQGLTGVAAISLRGGEDSQPLVSIDGQPPMLDAMSGAGLTLSQSARDALLKLNGILDSNAKPVKELIGNLNNFAAALSRNSDKVDGILAGLERMTGGARGPDTDKVFDFAAPQSFDIQSATLRGELTVPLPTAIFQLDTQNILFRPSKNEAPLPPGPRWADNLTRLVQSRVTQSFENAGYIGSVTQNTDVVSAEFQLLIDIRSFQMIVSPEPTAEVEFSAKIASTSAGKILDAKIFRALAPAKSAETEPAADALNAAFGNAAADLVNWVSGVLAPLPEGVAPPETPAATETQGSGDAPQPADTSAQQDAAAPDAPAPQPGDAPAPVNPGEGSAQQSTEAPARESPPASAAAPAPVTPAAPSAN
jgi:phospholipid/cholesterol/gamma-HCH transport system substrate-binding protein